MKKSTSCWLTCMVCAVIFIVIGNDGLAATYCAASLVIAALEVE